MKDEIALADRTLIADLDSYQQRLLFDRVGTREAWYRLRAQLRVADLLSDQLVVTDSQLFDGIFLLLLGPDGMAELLGLARDEPLPLVVVAREADLGAALGSMVANPGFIWSSAVAATTLARQDGIVVSPEDLARARQAWVEAAHRARLRVERYGGRFPIEDAFGAGGPPPPGVDAELIEAMRATAVRSRAFELLDGAAIDDGPREAVRWWWEKAYTAALARQHHATWLSFGPQEGRRISDPSALAGGSTGRRPRMRTVVSTIGSVFSAFWALVHRRTQRDVPAATTLPLDGAIATTMAHIPSSLFAVVRHRSRTAQAEWSRCRDRWSLLSIALVVRRTTTIADTWATQYRRLLRRTCVLLAAVALTVSAAVSPIAAGWAAIPLIVALLAEVPYAELRALFDSSPAKLTGIVHLPTRGTR